MEAQACHVLTFPCLPHRHSCLSDQRSVPGLWTKVTVASLEEEEGPETEACIDPRGGLGVFGAGNSEFSVLKV